MRIDVGALTAGQVVRTSFDEHVASGSTDLVLDGPVTGELEIARTTSSVRLRGTVRTAGRMVCSRCLTAFYRPLQATLDEDFPIGATGSAHADADLGLRDGPEPVLDVSEVLRQHLLLAAPMAPLCRPECRGLCPVCGVDRNEADCGHDARPVDPRWGPLAKLIHEI
ncbi:MAG TPA: DUF177 domain-containing protein [bacterium]